MKIIFSATNESVKVEVSNAGHDEDAHADDSLLTPEIKKEIDDLRKTVKLDGIRLHLLVSFFIKFNVIDNLG
jgi:hypothetical protein